MCNCISENTGDGYICKPCFDNEVKQESTLGVSDVDLGDGEIDFNYWCKVCNKIVNGADEFCEHCGVQLVR